MTFRLPSFEASLIQRARAQASIGNIPLAKIKKGYVVTPQSELMPRNAQIPHLANEVQFPIISESHATKPFDLHTLHSFCV
jgi:hypothetical protein